MYMNLLVIAQLWCDPSVDPSSIFTSEMFFILACLYVINIKWHVARQTESEANRQSTCYKFFCRPGQVQAKGYCIGML